MLTWLIQRTETVAEDRIEHEHREAEYEYEEKKPPNPDKQTELPRWAMVQLLAVDHRRCSLGDLGRYPGGNLTIRS